MAKTSLTARKRERTGKIGVTKVRNAKLIPAVIYGKKMDSIPLEVAPEDLKTALSGEAGKNTLLEISIENSDVKPALSILKDVQKDPLTGKPKHIDFQSIDPDAPIRVEIPIEFVGQSKGIKDGGILEEVERNFKIRCLPDKIPSKIEVDISELEIGDSLHIKDLSFENGLEVLNNQDETVVMVIAPRAAVSEAAQQVSQDTEGEEEGEETEKTEDTEEKKEKSEEGGKE